MKTMPPKPTLKLGTYRHYKGGVYEVLQLACHTETLEWYVVYQSLERQKQNLPSIWVRPYTIFTEEITADGKAVKRFVKI